MIYGSWDINCNKQIFFLSLWATFCPFTSTFCPLILHKYTKNHDHMLYSSWDMAHGTCNCYFSSKFQKTKKTPGDIIILHVYQQLWLDDVRLLRYCAQRTNGRTNRRKKWHIEVGAPPENSLDANNNTLV